MLSPIDRSSSTTSERSAFGPYALLAAALVIVGGAPFVVADPPPCIPPLNELTAAAEAAMLANPSPVIFQDPTRETKITISRPGFNQLIATSVDDPWYFPYGNVMSGVRGGLDIFMTVDATAIRPGAGEIDAHVGGEEFVDDPNIGLGDQSGDLWILGDERTPYYAGKTAFEDPETDFAYVTRFVREGSTIRLHGSPLDYVLAPAQDPESPYPGLALFYVADCTADMIAHIDRVTLADLSLTDELFQYAVAPGSVPALTGAVQLGGAGTEVWADAAIGPDGSLYQTFHSSTPALLGTGATGSFYLVKRGPTGELDWIRKHGTSRTELRIGELPFQIVATHEYVYVCGGTRGTYGGPAPTIRLNMGAIAFVAQFDAQNGAFIDVHRPVPNNAVISNAWAMTVDDVGRVVLAGGNGDTPEQREDTLPYVTLLDPVGLVPLWNTLLEDPNSVSEFSFTQEGYGGAVYVPAAGGAPGVGDVYVTGYTAFGDWFDNNEGVTGAWVGKLNSVDGTLQWVRTFSAPLDNQYPNGLAADPLGDVYAVGQTCGPMDGAPYNGNGDGFVRKLNPNGDWEWTTLIGTAESDDLYDAVWVADRLYIMGNTRGSFAGPNAGLVDVFVAVLDSEGNLLDAIQFGSEQIDYGRSLLHHDGWLYVSGMTEGALGAPNAGSTDAFLVRLTLGLDLVCWDEPATAADARFLFDCLAGPDHVAGLNCRPADLDHDGDIDLRDFASLQLQYGDACPWN